MYALSSVTDYALGGGKPVPLDENWKEISVAPITGLRDAADLRNAIPKGKGRVRPEEYVERCRSAQKRGMKSIMQLCHAERNGVAAVCGGGPSLRGSIPRLRALVAVHRADIIAVNKTPDWLESGGLKDGKRQFSPFRVKYGVLLDPKDWVSEYITPTAHGTYLLASQLSDKTFDRFKDHPNTYLWHAQAGIGEMEMLKAEFPKPEHEWIALPGPSVVGLRAIYLALFLGYREIHLFGIDGAGKKDTNSLYAYDKQNVEETYGEFDVNLSTGWTKTYWSNHHMARSVYEFEDMVKELHRCIKSGKVPQFKLRVHGDPELSAIAFLSAGLGIHADRKMNEKYGRPPEAKAA